MSSITRTRPKLLALKLTLERSASEGNIAASWLEPARLGGVRNCRGKVIICTAGDHSQNVNSRETAELWAFHWAFDSMKSLRVNKVIFEASCERARA